MKMKNRKLIAFMVIMFVAVSFTMAQAKIVWKSSGHGPASDPSQIFHDDVCRAITKASGGRLEVKPFVGGSIVPAYKEVDAINDNVLQMGYTCPMYNLDKWPSAGLISSTTRRPRRRSAAILVRLCRRRGPHEQDDDRLQCLHLPWRTFPLAR